jgi:hypothetical protein
VSGTKADAGSLMTGRRHLDSADNPPYHWGLRLQVFSV